MDKEEVITSEENLECIKTVDSMTICKTTSDHEAVNEKKDGETPSSDRMRDLTIASFLNFSFWIYLVRFIKE